MLTERVMPETRPSHGAGTVRTARERLVADYLRAEGDQLRAQRPPPPDQSAGALGVSDRLSFVKHRSEWAYSAGCRCAECVEA